MIRSALAIHGGYIAVAIVVGAPTAIAARLMSGIPAPPTRSYLAVNLAYSGVAALLGGVVCGLVSERTFVVHSVIALSLLVLGMSLYSMKRFAGQQPRWYQLLLAAEMLLLILGGGLMSGEVR